MSLLRPIERGTFNAVAPPANLGPAPQLQWIAIDRLIVDDGYQRPLDSQRSRQNVRAIAERFDWRRFAPVIVSPIEGGRYAIVDGQHRTTAALLVGIADVPCQVILADRREQALAFEAINGQVTQISRLQIHKAKLVAGDAMAARIAAVTAAAGVKLLTYNPSSLLLRPGETTALAVITRMIELHGDKTLRIALQAIRSNAGDNAGYLRATIIHAVTTVLADNHAWRDHQGLMTALDDMDLDEAWRTAANRATTVRGSKAVDQLQAMLITHLDRKLTSEAA